MPKEAKEKKKWTVGVRESEGFVLGPSMVKFLVGRDAEVFFVHENIISARTEYFIDTLQNFKKGAQVKVVRLPEEDPEIFTLYVQLVYTNVIPYIIDTGEGDDWECRSDHNSGYHQTCHDEYNILCRLYVLAETIEDTKAQNATISALFSKIKVSIDHERCAEKKFCFPPVQSINWVYENTWRHSAGQQILAHTYARHSDRMENPLPKAHLVPDEFLFDVAEAALDLRKYSEDCDDMDLDYYQKVIEEDNQDFDEDEESEEDEESNEDQESKEDQESNGDEESNDGQNPDDAQNLDDDTAAS